MKYWDYLVVFSAVNNTYEYRFLYQVMDTHLEAASAPPASAPKRVFKCILVTGACGAIGSEVVNCLKAKYPDTIFVNVDALTYAGKTSHIESPYDNYVFVHGDICDANVISETLDKWKPDGIVHFAAETHVDTSFGSSLVFTKTNVLGTHTLLECVKAYINKHTEVDFKMFLHMSTDEVYGSVPDDEPARHENSLFQPSNPYAATKAGAEMICHAYAKSFHIPICITRCNNAVSKYQHVEKLIPQAITRILANEKVPIHGKGESKRTFIHAYDIASAIDIVLNKGIIGSVYNIGAVVEYTVLDVVERIVQILKPNDVYTDWIEYIPDRAFQDYRYSIDTSALQQLGWKEHYTFDDALEYVISHFIQQHTSTPTKKH
jgi:dTDP-glucose 4,6-dehydratase